jgi:hypothetical protein
VRLSNTIAPLTSRGVVEGVPSTGERPQQYTAPTVDRPHDVLNDASIWVQLMSLAIALGVDRLVVWPSPISPLSPNPQQSPMFRVETPHVCASPAESCLKVSGAMSTGLVVAGCRGNADAARVYPEPGRVMARPAKLARPANAETVVVPSSTPPPGFCARESVTLPV